MGAFDDIMKSLNPVNPEVSQKMDFAIEDLHREI